LDISENNSEVKIDLNYSIIKKELQDQKPHLE